MLRSILRNKKALETLAMKEQSPTTALIAKLDWSMIEVLVTVLEPFADATSRMEADKYPTISLVLGLVCLLKKKMKILTIHEKPSISNAALDMLTDFNQR